MSLSYAKTPRYGSINSPVVANLLIMGIATLMGTAKPIPSALATFTVLIPTTSPFLPGIGPAIAAKIVAYREQNGKFKSIEDIMNVSGIGQSKFNNIKDFITVN